MPEKTISILFLNASLFWYNIRVSTGAEMAREKYLKVREKSGNFILSQEKPIF